MTSFIQYLVLAPSYINILNVYAFCNLHDVSWGTKGSDRVGDGIHAALFRNAEESTGVLAVEDVVLSQEDSDSLFEDSLARALSKSDAGQPGFEERFSVEDDNKTFRMRLVSAWLISNAILALIVQNIGGYLDLRDSGMSHVKVMDYYKQAGDKRNLYFAFILYATFGLALVRFLGVSDLLLPCVWGRRTDMIVVLGLLGEVECSLIVQSLSRCLNSVNGLPFLRYQFRFGDPCRQVFQYLVQYLETIYDVPNRSRTHYHAPSPYNCKKYFDLVLNLINYV